MLDSFILICFFTLLGFWFILALSLILVSLDLILSLEGLKIGSDPVSYSSAFVDLFSEKKEKENSNS